MVVVGRLVGTFEPARVMVEIAHATSASARANTIMPSQPVGTVAGKNGKGMSQLSASPPSTASAHAIGGRTMTFAVSAVSAMAGTVNLRSFRCGQLHPGRLAPKMYRADYRAAVPPKRVGRIDLRLVWLTMKIRHIVRPHAAKYYGAKILLGRTVPWFHPVCSPASAVITPANKAVSPACFAALQTIATGSTR